MIAPTKTKVVMKELWFDLTEGDFANKARRIAELEEKLEGAEAIFETAKSKFKAEQSKIEAEIALEVRAIRRKKEERLVECNQVHDYARAEVYYEHGGQIYERRAMEISERQPSLFPSAPKDPSLNTKDGPGDWVERARKAQQALAAEGMTLDKDEKGNVTGGTL